MRWFSSQSSARRTALALVGLAFHLAACDESSDMPPPSNAQRTTGVGAGSGGSGGSGGGDEGGGDASSGQGGGGAAASTSGSEGSGGSATGGSGHGGTGGAGSGVGGADVGGAGGSGSGGGGGNGGNGTGGGSSGSGSAGAICGGKQGLPCAKGFFCDFDPGAACGATDMTGLCAPTPGSCPKDCPGVCGCDGNVYCNACLAHAAGVDDASGESCNPPKCPAAVDEIAAQTSIVGSCTTAVRLDYVTKGLLAFTITCGDYAFVTEADARATAQADTGWGQSGTLVSGPNPQDEFVFWSQPADVGGVGVVSARNGLSVFGGSIVWDGKGDISHPDVWTSAVELGPGCGKPNRKLPPSRGFDLVSGMPLAQADVDAALEVVWGTALPEGLAKGAYVFDAVVLLYPRSVGAFEPSSAEWIVLVHSGWLE